MTITVALKNEKKRYEAAVDGQPAGFITYEPQGDVLDLQHTEIDSAYEGKGVGMICRNFCFDNGLIMRAVGDTMIIAPPLEISHAEIDEMVEKARKCLDLTYEAVK